MDTGNGNFAELTDRKFAELELKKANGLFKEGEKVQIHGSSFRVESISVDGTLVLKLMSDRELIGDSFADAVKISSLAEQDHRKDSMQARDDFLKRKCS